MDNNGRKTMTEDRCPTCRVNLGRQAFEVDAQAGDEIECQGCGEVFMVETWDNGTVAGYIWVPVEQSPSRV